MYFKEVLKIPNLVLNSENMVVRGWWNCFWFVGRKFKTDAIVVLINNL